MFKILIPIILICNLLFANIDLNKSAITIATFDNMKNVNNTLKSLDKFNVFIRQTTNKDKTLYVLYVVNIPKEDIQTSLKDIKNLFPSAYISSEYRIKKLINNPKKTDKYIASKNIVVTQTQPETKKTTKKKIVKIQKVKKVKKLVLTQKEKLWLEQQEPVLYVYDSDWKPFEWRNKAELHTGIIADIINLVKKKSKINFKQKRTKSWKYALETVDKNKAVMFSVIGENKKRKEKLNFLNTPLFSTPFVMVIRDNDRRTTKSFEDIKDRRVTVPKNYLIESILKEKESYLNLSTSKGIKNGLDMLVSGKTDVFIINYAAVQYYKNIMEMNGFKIACNTKYKFELKSAIRKDAPQEILSIMDKTLQSISQSEIDMIIHKWTYEKAIKVKTGVNINKISDINLIDKSVIIDFDIWFKYKGDVDFSKFYFANILEKYSFKNGTVVKKGKNIYRRYHIKKKFALDSEPETFNVDQHRVSFKLISKMTDSDKIKFMVDDKNMDKVKQSVLKDQTWTLRKAGLYEELKTKNALADPNLMKNNLNKFSVSTLNLHIVIDNNKVDLSSVISKQIALILTVLSIVLLLLTTLFRRKIYDKKFFKLIKIDKNKNTILNIVKVLKEKDIETLCEKLNLPQNISEVSKIMLKNIILFSINSQKIRNKYWQVKGSFSIEYDNHNYILKSSNIIDLRTKNMIIRQYDLLHSSNQQEIGQHNIQNSEENNFSIMSYSQYTSNINIDFIYLKNNIFKFNLQLEIKE